MMARAQLSIGLIALCTSFAFACGGGEGDGDSDGTDSSNTDGGSGDIDGGGGGGTDGGGNVDKACRHLDIVVAVDSSGSMDAEMEAMASEVFGGPNGFANALLSISDGLDDYRVGTIDACPKPAIMHTAGASAGECEFESGERWIVGNPQRPADDVIAEFECVGEISTEGQMCDSGDADEDEQPALAALRSLQPPFGTDENADFLREDAILVVIAITDEDEEFYDNSGDEPDHVNPQTAQEMYDEYVALKGDVKNMVFLGIGGGAPDGCTALDGDDPGTYGKALYAEKLHEVTNLFIDQERGVWWDLCDGNLGDGLSAAIDVIEQACDDFVPPVD